jgi:catechol 2,3-dioxygenase-like lactoylglutathione lyase family enzyme
MKVTGFNHAALNVSEHLGETLEFYTGVLGLRQVERNPMASRVKGAWFDVANAQIHVADEMWDGRARSPIGPHLSLWVDDIIAARAELELLDIQVFGLGEASAQVIWFSDPAGNTIELQQDPQVNLKDPKLRSPEPSHHQCGNNAVDGFHCTLAPSRQQVVEEHRDHALHGCKKCLGVRVQVFR